MATLLRRAWGNQKPIAGSQINWGHPLTRGLKAAFLLNELGGDPADLVSGFPLVRQANALWRPPGLFSGASASANGCSAPALPAWRPTDQASILWRGTRISNPDPRSGYLAGVSVTDTLASPYNSVAIDDGATNFGVRLAWNDGGSAAVTSTIVGAADVPSQYVGTLRSGIQNLYVRPGPPAATASTTWTSILYSSSQFGIGAHPADTTRYTNTVTDCVYLWGCQLSVDEVAWLYDEPYAFITPPGPKILYFDLAPPVPPIPAVEPTPAVQQTVLGQQRSGIQLPTLARLFKNTNPIFGTGATTLGAVTTATQGYVPPQVVPLQLLIWHHPVEGINLPELGPLLFKNTNPTVGASSTTLGAFTAAAAGSTTAPRLPQLELLFLPPPQLRLEVVGPTVFTHPVIPPVTGTSATTLGAFTSNAQGSATQPQLPQLQLLLLEVGAPPGVPAPILGPALFTPYRPVTGTSATTLGTFTGSGSGSATSPQLPQLQLLAAQPLGTQLPLFGPALFAAPPTVTGTVSVTLGTVTSSSSGSVGTPAQPWVQTILLHPPPAGVQLPLFPSRPSTSAGSVNVTLGPVTASGTGGTGPVGTLAVTLADLVAAASGSSVVGTVATILAACTCVATGEFGTKRDIDYTLGPPSAKWHGDQPEHAWSGRPPEAKWGD